MRSSVAAYAKGVGYVGRLRESPNMPLDASLTLPVFCRCRRRSGETMLSPGTLLCLCRRRAAIEKLLSAGTILTSRSSRQQGEPSWTVRVSQCQLSQFSAGEIQCWFEQNSSELWTLTAHWVPFLFRARQSNSETGGYPMRRNLLTVVTMSTRSTHRQASSLGPQSPSWLSSDSRDPLDTLYTPDVLYFFGNIYFAQNYCNFLNFYFYSFN